MTGKERAIADAPRFLSRILGRGSHRAAGAVEERLGLVAVLVAYGALFGALCITTDFLPYVLDGNESFSALVHARNMFEFGWAESLGLTDEAASLAPGAHPVIHTHQGNWPRIFAFVLYVLGARSVEAQIGLTTFTVGIAAIWFAYRFFLRIGPPLFAVIVCLVLISDYTLFAQWQVVTYRVWHGVFVFGVLLAVNRVGERRERTAYVLTAALFAALFYYELVFAVFLALFAAAYAAALTRREPRILVSIWSAQLAGALFGTAILALQLVGFMGLEDLLRDAALTLSARNFGSDEETLRESLRAFYASRNIAFFLNIVDGNALRNAVGFLSAFFRYGFQTHGPALGVAALLLTFGVLAGAAGEPEAKPHVDSRNDGAIWRFSVPVFLIAIGSAAIWLASGVGLLPFLVFAAVTAAIILARTFRARRAAFERVPPFLAGVALVAPATAFFALLFRDDAFAGLPSAGMESVAASISIGALAIITAILLAAGTVRIVTGVTARPTLSAGRVAGAATTLMFGAALLGGQSQLLDQSLAPIWFNEAAPAWLRSMLQIGLIPIAVLSAVTAMSGGEGILPGRFQAMPRALGVYLGCGTLAFAAVFVLAPGYVHSGYLWRYAPMVVFLVDIVIACATFVAVRSAISAVRFTRPIGSSPLLARYLPRAMTASAVAVPLALLIAWVNVQATNLRLLPPDSFAFVKRLRAPVFQGATSAASNYALPFHYQTGGWSYLDPELLAGRVDLTPIGYALRRGDPYLWFADRATNPAYTRPDLFICFVSQTFQTALADLRSAVPGVAPWCSTFGIMRNALVPAQSPLKHTILDRDRHGDKWAILRLDWDFPPYLTPRPGHPAETPVDARLRPAPTATRVEIAYTYVQQDGVPESRSVVEVFPIARAGPFCRLADKPLKRVAARDGGAVLPLPDGAIGEIVVAVTPRSLSKSGQRWLSNPLRVDGRPASACNWAAFDAGGAVYLRDDVNRKGLK